MTARAIVGLPVLGVLMTALAACSSTGTPPTQPTREAVHGAGSGASTQQRPEFHGSKSLWLRRGHQVLGGRNCAQDASRRRVCQAVGGLTYAAYGPSTTATLTDALMTPSRNHTAWLIRLQFGAASRQALHVAAARAADTREFVLVLDNRQQVLVPFDHRSLRGARVTVGPVTKAEAWDLVTLLTRH